MSQDRKQFTFDGVPNSPCYGCENRFVGCHSRCLEYIDFRQKVDAELVERQKRRQMESIIKQSSQKTMSETMRKARKARPVRPSQKD